MADGMVEWREWREWRNGGKNGRIAEWQKWLRMEWSNSGNGQMVGMVEWREWRTEWLNRNLRISWKNRDFPSPKLRFSLLKI